jgi:hypothetical protein
MITLLHYQDHYNYEPNSSRETDGDGCSDLLDLKQEPIVAERRIDNDERFGSREKSDQLLLEGKRIEPVGRDPSHCDLNPDPR